MCDVCAGGTCGPTPCSLTAWPTTRRPLPRPTQSQECGSGQQEPWVTMLASTVRGAISQRGSGQSKRCAGLIRRCHRSSTKTSSPLLRLLSAQKHDSPRWGDYPEKTNLTYIAGLLENGEWFDGTAPFISVKEDEEPNFYAPEFFLKRREKYRYLLDVPHSDEDSPSYP